MRIGLIPLDERPVNTRYPAMIAAIAGAELLLPPAQILSARRRPADCAAIGAWLEQSAPGLDGLIVSCEMLGYGGLIAARTSHEPVAPIMARLELLHAIRYHHPRLPIYGFNVVTRVSNANDAVEEPPYWARSGERLYAFSQLLDRRQQGQPVDAELGRLLAELPADQRHDFLARRLRNHAVNAAVLHMLATGVFDLLVLSSDDTSPFGLPSREKRWLAEWAELLGVGDSRAGEQGNRGTGEQGNRGTQEHRNTGTEERGNRGTGEQGNTGTQEHRNTGTGERGNRGTQEHRNTGTEERGNRGTGPGRGTGSGSGAGPQDGDRIAGDVAFAAMHSGAARGTGHAALLMYPGADEVGCVLLARLLNHAAGGTPRVAVAYAPPAAAANVAAYEDGPIQLTVERQLLAAGGELVPDSGAAELWLGVNAPLPRRAEWDAAHAAAERASRAEALQGLVAEARRRQRAGQAVAIADVAYPNGADPALVELLRDQLDLTTLAAYGGWNTAGNTVGTTLAQAMAARLANSAQAEHAHRRLLAHRLVEDWGYQHRVRAELRAWLRATYGSPEPETPAALSATRARIAARLATLLAELPGLGAAFEIAPGSVQLPWGRTFEVDFELTDPSKGGG